MRPANRARPPRPDFVSPTPAVGVAREQRLIAFVLRPTDVALVMILDEYLPRTHWLAVAIALARTTIHDRGALLALAVTADAGIEGILQNREDVTIPDWPPFERGQRPAVRRVGKVGVLRRHPQQHLAGAPEFTELLKDKPDPPATADPDRGQGRRTGPKRNRSDSRSSA